jgi:hypothetical protein
LRPTSLRVTHPLKVHAHGVGCLRFHGPHAKSAVRNSASTARNRTLQSIDHALVACSDRLPARRSSRSAELVDWSNCGVPLVATVPGSSFISRSSPPKSVRVRDFPLGWVCNSKLCTDPAWRPSVISGNCSSSISCTGSTSSICICASKVVCADPASRSSSPVFWVSDSTLSNDPPSAFLGNCSASVFCAS